jgi:hypothetical protein
MTARTLIAATAVALACVGCATRGTLQPATTCGYPFCTIDVRVVDDGSGGKKLELASGGNVNMMTRHRYAAILWTLQTDGYEFRGGSVRPHTGRAVPGKETTGQGAWDRQMIGTGCYYGVCSVTNANTERGTFYYDITVYPSAGTPGGPITIDPAIMNDP